MKKCILGKFILGMALFACLIPNAFAQIRSVPDQELIAKRNQIEKELADVAVMLRVGDQLEDLRALRLVSELQNHRRFFCGTLAHATFSGLRDLRTFPSSYSVACHKSRGVTQKVKSLDKHL